MQEEIERGKEFLLSFDIARPVLLIHVGSYYICGRGSDQWYRLENGIPLASVEYKGIRTPISIHSPPSDLPNSAEPREEFGSDICDASFKMEEEVHRRLSVARRLWQVEYLYDWCIGEMRVFVAFRTLTSMSEREMRRSGMFLRTHRACSSCAAISHPMTACAHCSLPFCISCVREKMEDHQLICPAKIKAK